MHEPRPRPGKHPSETHEDRALAKMLTAEEIEIFPYIFSDATIVDFDFSAWQQAIALYLIADHASEMRGYYPEVFVVNFLRVRQWNVAFNHLEDEEEPETERPKHAYWRISRYDAQPHKQGIELILWGYEEHPQMSIVCEGMTIREIPRYLLAQVEPEWLESGWTFRQPSIERLVRELKS